MSNSHKEKRQIYVAIGCLFREREVICNKSNDNKTTEKSVEVLLVKRREKRLPEIDNMWELPGGKVEKFESENQAVEREFLEETGYHVRAISALDRIYTVKRDYPEFEQETFISCYRCELISNERSITKPDSKVGAIRWFSTNEIDFFKTLVGSREFLSDIAIENGIKVNGPRTTTMARFQVPNNSKLASAKKRKGRIYIVIIQFNPDIKEHYYLITHRASYTNNHREALVEDFLDNESAIKQAKKRVQQRFWHGYILCKFDKDFPLLTWINDRNYPINTESTSQLNLPFCEP